MLHQIIFCSSLPGNDVKQKISNEVKAAINESVIDFVILSADYFDSAYCLNEEGIIWAKDKKIIIIALEEINHHNMIGFLNEDYKLRSLGNSYDIDYIFDVVCETLDLHISKVISSSISHKIQIEYNSYLNRRPKRKVIFYSKDELLKDITDLNAHNILYYFIFYEKLSFEKSEIEDWLISNEIIGVNINIGVEILQKGGLCKSNGHFVEIIPRYFGLYSNCKEYILSQLEPSLRTFQIAPVDTFRRLWNNNQFTDTDLLFIAYIAEEQIISFGGFRNRDLEHIELWENKKGLEENSLKSGFYERITRFIEFELIFKKMCSRYDEYYILSSLRKYLTEFYSENKRFFEDLIKRYTLHDKITFFHVQK